MNINIPEAARDHFWKDPPEGSWEFWSFRFQPPCEVGDKLIFRYGIGGKPVAQATVAKIEGPGESSCETTGRFRMGWKVFWHPESFVDLREKSEVVDER